MASQQGGELVIRLDLGESGDTFDERVDPTAKLAYSRNLRPSTGLPKKAPRVIGAAIPSTESNPYQNRMSQCHGFACAPDGDESIAYFRPRDGQARFTDANGVGNSIYSTMIDEVGQNGYFPIRVKTCQVSQLGFFVGRPVMCIADDGNVWTASVKDTSGSLTAFSVYVSVDRSDGTRLAASFQVTASAATVPWIDLTYHGENGVRLWHMSRTSYQIEMIDLELASSGINAIVINSTTNIFVPLACTPTVCSNDGTYAWLLTRSSSVAADCVLHRVEVATGTRIGLVMVGSASASSAYFALSHAYFDSTGSGDLKHHVAFAISDTATNITFGVVDGDTMVADWSTSGLYTFDRVAVAIRAVGNDPDDKHAILAMSTNVGVVFDARRLGLGGASQTTTAYWTSLASQGASWNIDPGSDSAPYPEVYPFFAIRHVAGSGDPSVGLVVLQRFSDASWAASPVGRFAVDELGFVDINLGQLPWDGDLMGLMYPHSLPGNTNPEQVPKYVLLDMMGQNVGVAYHDGCALVAAAQPVYWDGAETVELGYRVRPAVLAGTGGTGSDMTGTWRFKAVYRYTDARGNVRRSAPSSAADQTYAAQKALVSVTVPSTMRNGIRQDDIWVELYLTYWDGALASSDYYFREAIPAINAVNGYVVFDPIENAVPTNALLYTLEGGIDELPAEAPPALWDICSIGDRVWFIEAENRQAVGYSKRKDVGYVGYGVEFSRLQRIMFPAGAGKLMAVRDGGGYPLFFASDGIYAVSGDGPESNLTGTLFSPPRQVSKIGCESRESVIATPFGVFFCTDEGRAAVVSAGQVKVFDEIELSGCQGGFVYESESEVIFAIGNAADPTTGAYKLLAYNWRRDTWNTWYNFPVNMYTVMQQPSTTDGLFFSRTLNDTIQFQAAYRITNEQYAPSSAILPADPLVGQLVMRTPWLLPAGDNGDMAFQEVIFRARKDGTHALAITVEYDYGETSGDTFTRNWTNAELDALIGEQDMYTVCVRLTRNSSRSIRVTVTESLATTMAMRPISLTLPYGVSPGSQRRALKQGATK